MKRLIYPKTGSQIAFARLATAIAVLSVGAMAIGALAIGRLSIKGLAIHRGQIDKLSIKELRIDRLSVRQEDWEPSEFRRHQDRH